MGKNEIDVDYGKQKLNTGIHRNQKDPRMLERDVKYLN